MTQRYFPRPEETPGAEALVISLFPQDDFEGVATVLEVNGVTAQLRTDQGIIYANTNRVMVVAPEGA